MHASSRCVSAHGVCGHGAFVSGATAACSAPEEAKFGCRALEEMFLAYGARIGYWRGSIEGMIDDLGVRLFRLLPCLNLNRPPCNACSPKAHHRKSVLVRPT